MKYVFADKFLVEVDMVENFSAPNDVRNALLPKAKNLLVPSYKAMYNTCDKSRNQYEVNQRIKACLDSMVEFKDKDKV